MTGGREESPRAVDGRAVGGVRAAALLALHPLLTRGLVARRDVHLRAALGSLLRRRAGHGADGAPTGAREADAYLAELDRALPGGARYHLTLETGAWQRGVELTVNLTIPDGTSDRDVLGAYREAYEGAPTVRLARPNRGLIAPPDQGALEGTNAVELAFALEPDSGRLTVVCALDGLVEGAAGGALRALGLANSRGEAPGRAGPGEHP